ncbi:MAG: DUF4159 domain-containing protein [Planctomycetia bacterium]|nr:DUF4159 domain-containing protein [Planctomycetia bacterium]
MTFRGIIGAVTAVAVLLTPARTLWAQAPDKDLDPTAVSESIDRGVRFLKSVQAPNGSWSEYGGQTGAKTALATLALLSCGLKSDDPAVAAALRHLRTLRPRQTYAVSLQTMVFCAAEPKKDILSVQENVRFLEQQQIAGGERKGAWGYPAGPGDNSNSQFALLALYEAERIGVSVKQQTWKRAYDYWMAAQLPDGSFSYMKGETLPGTASMTCAGIGALVITSGEVNAGDAAVNGNNVQCCGNQTNDDAIERAVAWLARNFQVDSNAGELNNKWLLYYLYGVERVGRLTARRHIGDHDWYREGAKFLIEHQNKVGGGSWQRDDPTRVESDEVIATSLALLFLSKGRRPVLMSKLEHEPNSDWNNHRRDAAHLTSYVEKQWRRDLTWQVVNAEKASVDDLLQSPVIYISGREAPELSQPQIERLRRYIEAGGFIFAEACCEGKEFDAGFRGMMERMFPEEEYRLRLLPPTHSIWSAEERVDPEHVRPLWGIDFGCRTSVVYCPENLSCYWELDRPERQDEYDETVRKQIAAANSIGINVLAYATGRELKFKDEIPSVVIGDGPADAGERGTLRLPNLIHAGGHDVAPGALSNLLRFVSQKSGVRVSTDQREVSLSDPKLYNFPILFMHGRNQFQLKEEERQQLRSFLERGGVLIANSVCASEAFAASFEAEMRAIFPEHALQPIPGDHDMFTGTYGGFELPQVTLRRPASRAAGSDRPATVDLITTPPRLDGLQIDERYAVLFSRYDLSCALEKHDSLECEGYTREDAAKIGLNLIMYAMQR